MATTDEDLVRDRVGELLAAHDPKTTKPREFLGAQFDAGLAWVQFPEGLGGLGVSPKHQAAVNAAIVDAGGSTRNRFLNIIGVLSYETVAKHRRLVIFLMFVFGAIVTPGGDPIAMMALAAPMIVLFSAAALFMKLREKRQPASEFGHLSDDEASPLPAGPWDVIACFHFLHRPLFRAFVEARRGHPGVVWITEAEPLGTGGAIVNALDRLEPDEPFVALNGDILTDLDLSAMVATHRRSGAAATIALTHVDDARPYGLVPLEADDRVIEFREKPTELVPGNVNAGTYVLQPSALEGWERGRASPSARRSR